MTSVWTATLESFRDRLSSCDPAPAGVTTAAVSATFALALLIKILDITRNRKSFTGDARQFDELIAAARAESERLSQLADEDIAAFTEYLATRSDSARRKTIAVPLAAAEAAASALKLCQKSTALIPAPMAPDLETAKALLKAAIHAILSTLHSNLQQEPDPRFREKIEQQLQTLEKP